MYGRHYRAWPDRSFLAWREGARGLGLLALALLWTLSCSPTPTSTLDTEPTPTPSPRQIIEKSGVMMAALKTAEFTLEVEGGTSALFFGVDLRLMEGQVDMPDRFKISVEAVLTFPRTFIEINLVGVGDKVFISDFIRKDKWVPVQAEDIPFDFANLGHTLSAIFQSIEDPILIGTEIVDGMPSWRLKGTVLSETLATLVLNAESGFEVGLEGWIDQAEGLLRKVTIEGQIYSQDDPSVIRVLTLRSFDEPVEISLPEME